MGLLAKIFNDASDTEFKLAQDLVAIAIADGEISETERKAISDICQREGITNETMKDCMLGFDKDVKSIMPVKRRDKTDYITNLIRVMSVDGNSSPMEIYLLEIIASKMGISHMELVSLVLMTASRRFFTGDTGSMALSSFLQNVIDPRSKNLCDNRNSIRKLFDLMARNVPQLQNEEEDRNAFINAMNKGTELMMENTLLCNEFRSMGIDFEMILMDEREQALRRWMNNTPHFKK